MTSSQTWFQSIWYWRLAFFECITDMFIVGALAFISSVVSNDWSQLSKTQKVVIYLSTAVAMVKILKSNLSTTIQTLKDNQPIPEGTTVQQQTTTTQITNTAIPVPATVSVPAPVIQQSQLGSK